MSAGRLGLRAFLAAVSGAIAFVLFSYVPASAGTIAADLAGPSKAVAVSSLAGSLASPGLPALGIAVAALIFLSSFFRGTKAYGPVLVTLGSVLLAYVYLMFHGGTISAAVRALPQYSAEGTFTISLAPLMYLFMLPPLLTVVKGAFITAAKPDRPSPSTA